MAAVGAWPVSWAVYGCCGGEALPLGPVWRPWGLARLLGPLWTPWVRGPSPGLRMATVGASPFPLAESDRREGRGLSAKHRMAAVGARPVFWAPYGRRWGVARPLGPV